jgi:hypothetical protein
MAFSRIGGPSLAVSLKADDQFGSTEKASVIQAPPWGQRTSVWVSSAPSGHCLRHAAGSQPASRTHSTSPRSARHERVADPGIPCIRQGFRDTLGGVASVAAASVTGGANGWLLTRGL